MKKINKKIKVYGITVLVGFIITILSFSFLTYSNMGIMGAVYGIAVICFYFGGHIFLKLDRWDITKINLPLMIPIFLAVIFGYTIDTLDFIVLAMKFVPMCITLSAVLLEKYILD